MASAKDLETTSPVLGMTGEASPAHREETERCVPVEWNATERDYPQGCLHELFAAQAKRTPDVVAVADEKQRLTYRELNARANQVSRHLRKLGVGPEVLVGVAVERTAELLVALLGILKAGGAYVPLDPEYPAERLAFMVKDAGLRVIVTQAALGGKLPETGATRVCLDADWGLIAQESGEDWASGAEPGNLVYVIYTSGSTGAPKGVLTSHRSLVNLLAFARERPGFTAEDTFLALNTISFDMSKPELYLPLIVGGRVYVARRGIINDVAEFEGCVAQSGATVLQGPPSLWRLLIESGWEGGKGYKIICGGEVLGASLARELLKRSRSLWNGYGPTETTVWATMYQVEGADSPILIGTPVGNTQTYILDDHLQPVRVGEAGELYVGGVGLARGYLNRPELTAERFIANPFSGEAGARLYKTGDLARYREDGNIEFLGRVDHQVQIRGYRVETGEVEAVLSEHEGVEGAAVVAWEEGPGHTRLVAYIVARSTAAPSSEELRGFLKKKLPEWMLPARFEFLPALPLTPSGKVDRLALPAPGRSREASADLHSAPQTELEKKLERIFASVLGLDWVGVDEDFFDLGGDSLNAAKLMSRVERVVGKKISFATLFHAPTVRNLAAFLSGDRSSYEQLCPLPIQPLGSRPPFFCVGGGPSSRVLGQLLAPDQPFLGLVFEDAELQTLPVPFRVEDLAAILVRKMQAEQPTGPYFLGGWCFQGYVAYEVARQLRAKGEEVGLLILIWIPLPRLIAGAIKPSGASLAASRFSHKLGFALFQLRTAGWAYVSKGLARRFASVKSRASLIVYRLYCRMRLPVSGWMRQWTSIENFSSFDYRPEPYWGRVALVRAEPRERTPYPEDDDWGWRVLAKGDLEVHFVPFVHDDVFVEPNVELTAKKLKELLLKAQGNCARDLLPGKVSRS